MDSENNTIVKLSESTTIQNESSEEKDNNSSQGNDDEEDDEDDQEIQPSSSDGPISSKPWTKEEDEALKKAVNSKKGSWKEVADIVGGGRTVADCIQRWNKTLRPSIIKGYWTSEEDAALLAIMTNNFTSWKDVARQIVGRSTKQCRERWSEYLDPSLDHGPFSPEEDAIITREQAVLGNKWKAIAERLGGRRTATSVKVRWNSISRRAKNSWANMVQNSAAMMYGPGPPGGIPMFPAHPHPAPHLTHPHPMATQYPPQIAFANEPPNHSSNTHSSAGFQSGFMSNSSFPVSSNELAPPHSHQNPHNTPSSISPTTTAPLPHQQHPMFMPWMTGASSRGASVGMPWYAYPPVQTSDAFGFMTHARDMYPTGHPSYPMPGPQSRPPSGTPSMPSMDVPPSFFVSQGWSMGLRPDQQEMMSHAQHIDPQYFPFQQSVTANPNDNSRMRPSPMGFTPAIDFGGRFMAMPTGMMMSTNMHQMSGSHPHVQTQLPPPSSSTQQHTHHQQQQQQPHQHQLLPPQHSQQGLPHSQHPQQQHHHHQQQPHLSTTSFSEQVQHQTQVSHGLKRPLPIDDENRAIEDRGSKIHHHVQTTTIASNNNSNNNDNQSSNLSNISISNENDNNFNNDDVNSHSTNHPS